MRQKVRGSTRHHDEQTKLDSHRSSLPSFPINPMTCGTRKCIGGQGPTCQWDRGSPEGSQRKVSLIYTSPSACCHVTPYLLLLPCLRRLNNTKITAKRPQISSLLHRFPQNSEVRGIYENISFIRRQSVRGVNLLCP